MKWIDHQADYIEEHEAKERVFEEAILISEYRYVPQEAYEDSERIVAKALKGLQDAVHDYQIIRMRNEEFRREDYRMREVMLS